MDERLKNAFLELLRSGMWGTQPDAAYFSEFSETDWYAVHTIACKQAVIAVCLQAVCRLSEGFRPPSPLLLKWIGQGKYIEAQNRKIAEIWTELNEKFSTEGIYPVILKGPSFADNYAEPLSRQFGDLDLLIPDKFEKAVALVRSWSCKVKSTKEHDSFYYKGVYIELHSRINSFDYDCKLPCNPMMITIKGSVPVRIPDVNTECILLLVHAAKHLIKAGIGYRLLCDWAAFLNRNHHKINVQLVSAEINKIGIRNFVVEFTEIAFRELNLPIDKVEFGWKKSNLKYNKRLTEELFFSGDFSSIRNKILSLHSFKDKMDFYIWYKISRWYYWPRAFLKSLPGYLGRMIFLKVRKTYRQLLKKTPHRT